MQYKKINDSAYYIFRDRVLTDENPQDQTWETGQVKKDPKATSPRLWLGDNLWDKL